MAEDQTRDGVEFFGFEIKRKPKKKERIVSFVPERNEDGSLVIGGNGRSLGTVDFVGVFKNDAQLITKYRNLALQSEVEKAINNIIHEMIVVDETDSSIEIVLDEVEIPESIKKKIRTEFESILKLLDFNNEGQKIAKQWYVDGRYYMHIMINMDSPSEGIKELRYVDSRKIKPVYEVVTKTGSRTGADIEKKINKYYLYNYKDKITNTTEGLKVAHDAIAYIHSGIADPSSGNILSYLHKAIKTINQLRYMEDASVIYRLTRAPERRVFKIDIGNLPPKKASEYVNSLVTRYKNKLVYNATSGEISDARRDMTMTEDFWLPVKDGRGTQIDTLPGGANLGEIEDIEYFRRKLFDSLNVPLTRLEPADSGFQLGRASEISRDELMFSKFINHLRRQFSELFNTLLRTQLILKGIISIEDWELIKKDIYYDFVKDNYFTELKEAEIMTERLSLLQEISQYEGQYFSRMWIQKNVLRMDDEEIKMIEDEIEEERKKQQNVDKDQFQFQQSLNPEDPNGEDPSIPAPKSKIVPFGKRKEMSQDKEVKALAAPKKDEKKKVNEAYEYYSPKGDSNSIVSFAKNFEVIHESAYEDLQLETRLKEGTNNA